MPITNKHIGYLNRFRGGLGAILLMIACTTDSPKIYLIHDSEKTLTTFNQISQTATTEAGMTSSNFRFVDHDSGELKITLQFRKAVPPQFAGGSFYLKQGNEIYQGSVSPVNFRYLGGQGDGVSVGGDFLFSTPDNEYRVHLPLTAIETYGY